MVGSQNREGGGKKRETERRKDKVIARERFICSLVS